MCGLAWESQWLSGEPFRSVCFPSVQQGSLGEAQIISWKLQQQLLWKHREALLWHFVHEELICLWDSQATSLSHLPGLVKASSSSSKYSTPGLYTMVSPFLIRPQLVSVCLVLYLALSIGYYNRKNEYKLAQIQDRDSANPPESHESWSRDCFMPCLLHFYSQSLRSVLNCCWKQEPLSWALER